MAGVALALIASRGVLARAAPVSARPAPLAAAFGLIAPGKWVLHDIDSASGERSLCVADPDMLVQLEHSGRQCTRFVVNDSPMSATVHYTCPRAGHGRTVIQVENAHSFRLDTLGIASGAPFEFRYEAHRVSACPPAR